VLIDLSLGTRIEINLFGGCWGQPFDVDLKTNFKIARMFFRTKDEGKQELKIDSRWIGDRYPYEYTVCRPQAIVRNVTHLCVMGNPKQKWCTAWPARFDSHTGTVYWQIHARTPAHEDDLERTIWVSLWDGLEEDNDQLSFDWNINRFDLIE